MCSSHRQERRVRRPSWTTTPFQEEEEEGGVRALRFASLGLGGGCSGGIAVELFIWFPALWCSPFLTCFLCFVLSLFDELLISPIISFCSRCYPSCVHRAAPASLCSEFECSISLVCRSLSTLGAGYSPAQSSCCWLALPHIFPTCTQGACMFPGYISAHTSLFDCLTRKPQCVTSKGIFFILPVREVPMLTVYISTLGIISHIIAYSSIISQ